MTDMLQLMRSDKWFHQKLAWLTLCAVLFGVFAPSVSKLLAASEGTTWIELCDAQGVKRIAIDLGNKQSPEPLAMAGEHCGYCLLQQHSAFVPTSSSALIVAPSASNRLTYGSGGTTLFKRFIRDAHPTRAPPLFS